MYVIEVSLLQVGGYQRCVCNRGIFITGGWLPEVCVCNWGVFITGGKS